MIRRGAVKYLAIILFIHIENMQVGREMPFVRFNPEYLMQIRLNQIYPSSATFEELLSYRHRIFEGRIEVHWIGRFR